MLDRNLIGKEIFLRREVVERGAILRFAEATGFLAGDGHPEALLKKDPDVAPPMFAMALGVSKRLFEMLKVDPRLVLLGEQSIDLASDIRAGDELEIATSVKDLYQRVGTSGMMAFMVIEDEGHRLDGSPVFRMRRTFIARTRPEQAPERSS
ncbi:MAG: MaoC family dehydratase N-terminal domain-containing protein [Myxococcales bacterium]|jgi:hypothetical protein|nr:MaoC family dehydratase N-terminal domain-containing protein [Myxococcales bacterium]